VMFLHREKSAFQPGDGGDASTIETSPTELIIAKQRNGPIGTVKLVFMRNYTKFEEASDRDAPGGY